MATCLGAQHAHVRLNRTDRDVDQLARLLDLLAAELGVDLDQLAAHDTAVARGYPVTWQECEAVGIDPDTGEAA